MDVREPRVDLSVALRPRDFRTSTFTVATALRDDPSRLRALAAAKGYLFLPGLLGGDTIGPIRAYVRRFAEA